MEAPNKLMIMCMLAFFHYNAMIPHGLTRISSGAPYVIRGVLGEIGVIWPRSRANDGDVELRGFGPDYVRQAIAEGSKDSV